MSSVLPFDIIDLIIDIVGENEDTNLLKKLALVSHSLLHISSKHLFATVELHDAIPKHHVASSKKGFVKLLKSRPDVVRYIRKLKYKIEYNHLQLESSLAHPNFNNDDHLLSPILPNFLQTIPRLNCLTITAAQLDWKQLNSSLTSAFLHLMHLPTINHIDLSYIQSFPLSSLTPSVNLLRLDIFHLRCFNPLQEDRSSEIVVQSDVMPKIREFHTSESSLLTTMLLNAKRQDGQPAYSFTDVRRLSVSSFWFEDEWNNRYLLQNARLLEELHLSVGPDQSSVGLHNNLSPCARTLKVLALTVSLNSVPPLLAGHYCILEALFLEVQVDGDEAEDFIGSIMQKVEEVLVGPGWSALRQVSFKISIACCLVPTEYSAKLSEALQSIPDKYLNHLPKLESVAFNFSARVVKCSLNSNYRLVEFFPTLCRRGEWSAIRTESQWCSHTCCH